MVQGMRQPAAGQDTRWPQDITLIEGAVPVTAVVRMAPPCGNPVRTGLTGQTVPGARGPARRPAGLPLWGRLPGMTEQEHTAPAELRSDTRGCSADTVMTVGVSEGEAVSTSDQCRVPTRCRDCTRGSIGMRSGLLALLVIAAWAFLSGCVIESRLSGAAVRVVSTSGDPVVGFQERGGGQTTAEIPISGVTPFSQGFDSESEGRSFYDFFVIADAETGEVLFRRVLAREPLFLEDKLVWDGKELQQLTEGEQFPADVYTEPAEATPPGG